MLAEYPKEFAVTTKPPSGREGDRGGAVEGERDCVFSELEVKLWAEGDGVCFPQKITLIYYLNEPAPFLNFFTDSYISYTTRVFLQCRRR